MNDEKRVQQLYSFMLSDILKNKQSKYYVRLYLLNLKKDRNIRNVKIYNAIKYEPI